MAREKICTLIGSDKGGVGKSLIAQIMILANDVANIPLSVVEIDHQRKLTSVFGDRVNLSLGASVSIDELLENRRAAESFFNTSYDTWRLKDSVTDLGANVTTSMLSWMKHCDIPMLAKEDGIRFRFLSVCTPDDQAIRSSTTALEHARSILGPNASLFLVLNNFGGTGFAPYQDTDTWRQAMEVAEKFNATIVQIPYCDSIIMEWVRALNLTVLDILDEKGTQLEDIVQRAELGRVERHLQVKKFSSWINDVQLALAAVFSDVGADLEFENFAA